MSTVPPGGQYGQPQQPQQPGQYGQPPQQPGQYGQPAPQQPGQYGQPQPGYGAPQQPRAPRGRLPLGDILCDAFAALFLIIALFYDWTFSQGVTDQWWVLISALVLVAGLSITYLAHFGVLGANWNLGYNRLVRLGAGLPYFGSIIGLIIYDIVKDEFQGGFGPGAVIGIFAFVLAVQPRRIERPSAHGGRPTVEDTVWFWLAPAALGISVLVYLGTTLFRIGDVDGTLDTIFEILVLITFLVAPVLLLIGFLQRRAAWVNVTAVYGSFIMAVVFLFNLFSQTSVVFMIDLTHLTGDSFKVPASGAWLLAVAGAAAFAPGNSAFVGERLSPEAQRASVCRGLIALGAFIGCQVVAALYFTISAVDNNADTKYVVFGVIATIFTLLMAVGAIIASQVAAKPGATNAGLVVAGFAAGYVVLSIILAIVGAAIFDSRDHFSIGITWVGPLLLALVIVFFQFGLDAIKAKAGSTLQTMQTADAQQPPQGQYGQPSQGQYAQPAAQPQAPAGDPGQYAPPAQPQADPNAGWAPAPQQAPAQPSPPQPTPPAAPADPIADELANPGIDQARLADIARDYPQHRAAVAAHPQAYPGLVEWLGALGDPAVNQAIANRQG